MQGTGEKFDIVPPTLEEYIPLDQVFPPAPEVITPADYVYGI